jgi:hypothetical protein
MLWVEIFRRPFQLGVELGLEAEQNQMLSFREHLDPGIEGKSFAQWLTTK